jgi:hypothetical protein
MKITLAVDSAKNGGNLYTLVDDLTNLNSQVAKSQENDILTIDDTNATLEQKIPMDQATLLSILAEPNGEISEHLMAIRATNVLAGTLVPAGLPIRQFADGSVVTFIQWFLPGAELWDEDGGNDIIFYTNPAAGLAAITDFLTGSQMEIIRQLDTINYSILSTEDADVITATGWTKVDWENL